MWKPGCSAGSAGCIIHSPGNFCGFMSRPSPGINKTVHGRRESGKLHGVECTLKQSMGNGNSKGITLMQDTAGYSNQTVLSILERIERINRLTDVDAVLDRILSESRDLANADAGSIFLVQGDHLEFAYVQNNTLFGSDTSTAALYENIHIPMDESSIAGCTAVKRRVVVIDDAYNLPQSVPYSFNRAMDEKSGYRTRSILSIPLQTMSNRLVGIMQLINAGNHAGEIVPFDSAARTYVPLLASHAAAAVERSIMNRELVLRMNKLAELRDPTETGAHVQRVGAYAAEIYQAWALKKDMDRTHVKRTKDLLRLAAMMHDVGKVGVPDRILKKPGKLTDEEYAAMKLHTVYGYGIFSNRTGSSLDDMCADIALHHHQRWDGKGYPGKIPGSEKSKVDTPGPLKGEEIPITARVTAIADVYDALVSRRSYKKAWDDDRVKDELLRCSAAQFDPDVVDAMLGIMDVIKAIRRRFN